MFEKLHVGVFINEYMEVLNLSNSALSRLSGVSRDHIINLKNCSTDLNFKTAVDIAPFLQVSAEFLMNLQILYTKQQELWEVQKIESKLYKSLTPNFKQLLSESSLSKKKYDLFVTDDAKYTKDFQIVHYQPRPANIFKNFLLVESLNGFEFNNNVIDASKLEHYLRNDFYNNLIKINSSKSADEFISKLRKDLYHYGINLKLMNTGVKTTIKGITKLTPNNAITLVENNNVFADVIWYIVHELCHIIMEHDEKHQTIEKNEELVNNMTKIILIKDYSDKLNNLTKEQILNSKDVNVNVLMSIWLFNQNKHKQLKNHLGAITVNDNFDSF